MFPTVGFFALALILLLFLSLLEPLVPLSRERLLLLRLSLDLDLLLR